MREAAQINMRAQVATASSLIPQLRMHSPIRQSRPSAGLLLMCISSQGRSPKQWLRSSCLLTSGESLLAVLERNPALRVERHDNEVVIRALRACRVALSLALLLYELQSTRRSIWFRISGSGLCDTQRRGMPLSVTFGAGWPSIAGRLGTDVDETRGSLTFSAALHPRAAGWRHPLDIPRPSFPSAVPGVESSRRDHRLNLQLAGGRHVRSLARDLR
jgi:hypothetical protein